MSPHKVIPEHGTSAYLRPHKDESAFENQGDSKHITHAFKFKTGERMAAIGGGWRRKKDKKSVAFQNLINDYGIMDEPNPAGSFKSSGTMVGTRTVVLWKS